MDKPATQSKFYAWLVWGVAASFYIFEYMIQVSPNFFTDELLHDLQLNSLQIGYLGSAYFVTYTLMQIPAGIILDIIGPRFALILAISITIVGSYLFAVADHLTTAIIARAFTGIGSAFALLSALKLAVNWFPVRLFAFVSGLTLALGTLGASFGSVLAEIINKAFSWRELNEIYSVVGIIILIMVIVFVRNRSRTAPQPQHTMPVHKLLKANAVLFKDVLKNKQNWIAALYFTLTYGSISVLGTLWGYSFLMAKYPNLPYQNTFAISLMFIGLTIGSPISGWLASKTRSKKTIMYYGSFFAAIALFGIVWGDLSNTMTLCLFLVYGLVISSFVPIFDITCSNNSREMSATAMGFINMASMLGGGVILETVIGDLLKGYDNVHHLTLAAGAYLHHFSVVLSMLPLITLLGFITIFFIREGTFKKRVAEN